MEVYILDSLLRRSEVVDKFDSLIWTERYQDIGDFDLVLRSTREARGQFREGTLLAVNTSWRVMMVETVEDVVDDEGRKLLNVKGKSLELILRDRIAKKVLTNLTVDPTWVITDIPGNIARKIFDDIVRNGTLSLADKIPFLMPGTIMPPSTILESQVQITKIFEPQTVFDAIKSVCDLYDLGFRLVRNFDMSQLYFDIYSGNDLTTRQTTRDPVIFALENENLQSTTELRSVAEAKNVAYVFSEFGYRVVYGDNVEEDVDGFDRRVLLVNATDIEETMGPVEVQEALLQQGLEALRPLRQFSGFDGEVTRGSPYKYGVHYELGDIVEVRNEDGEITYKRVTEQIFTHDAEGERAFPTLTMNEFISSNTWLSQKPEKIWADFGLTEYWNTM